MFNSGSAGFAADSGAVRAAGMTDLGTGIESTPAAGPEALGKDTVRGAVDIAGMTEAGVGCRATAGVGTAVAVVVGTVAVAVGRHCSTCAVVGAGSTVKSIVVTVDYWECSRRMADLVPVDRTGHPWLAHKCQARKGSNHSRSRRSRRSRSKVVVGKNSHSVCCTDNYCSRDVLGSNHSRTVGLDTGTVVDMVVVDMAADMAVGRAVGRAAGRAVGRAAGTAVGTAVGMGVGVEMEVVDTVDKSEGS